MSADVDHERGEGEKFPPDTRPYLCIPYWTAPLGAAGKWDTGQVRPLPTAVVSYLCESIHAGPYTPGQPLDVTVDVRNSGGGNSASIVTVAVYWADPTVGFAKPNFFAASAVAVPPSRTVPAVVSTPKMRARIPATAPPHVCLLVAVSHPQDRAGTVCNPFADRHWAQRNLTAAQVAPGAPALVPFVAANPFGTERSFYLRIGPVDERHARLVALEFGTRPADARAQVRLLDADGAELSDAGEELAVDLGLGPLERRRFQLMVELDRELPPGESTAIEAKLHDSRGHDRVVGSLGVVVLGR
jgi:hypothetical protein